MKSTIRAITEIRQQNNKVPPNGSLGTKRLEHEQKEKRELDDRLLKCIEARDKYKRKFNDTKNELKRINTVCSNLAKELEAKKHDDNENEQLREMVTKLETQKRNMDQGQKDSELLIKHLQHEKESLSEENNRLMLKTEELNDEVSKLQKYKSDFTDILQQKKFLTEENRDLKEVNGDLKAQILELQVLIKSSSSGRETQLSKDGEKRLENENHALKTEVVKLNEDIFKQKQAAEQYNLTILRQTKLIEEQATTIEDLRGDCSEMLETLQQLEAENDLLSSVCGDLDDNVSSKLTTTSESRRKENGHHEWGEERSVIEKQKQLINKQVATIEQYENERKSMLAKIDAIHGENSTLARHSTQGDDSSIASVAIESFLERLELIEEMKDAEINILVEERAEMLDRLNSLKDENRAMAEQLENLKEQKDAQRDREFAELKEKVALFEIERKKLSEINATLTSEIEKRNELRAKARNKLSARLTAYEKKSLGSSVISIERIRSRMETDRTEESTVISGVTFSTASEKRTEEIAECIQMKSQLSPPSDKKSITLNVGEKEASTIFVPTGSSASRRPEIIRVPSDITTKHGNFSPTYSSSLSVAEMRDELE